MPCWFRSRPMRVLVTLLPMGFGNHGLWAALMGLNALRGFTMWRLYPRAAAGPA